MRKWISAVAVIAIVALLLCACSKEAQSLEDVFTKMKTDYDVTNMLEYTELTDLERFYGIAAEDVEEFSGGVNNSGVDQEEIVMIKATDADAAARIETALQNRLNSRLNETKNYNPEQYAIIEKCSVDVDDVYVSLFISEDADAMKADYRKAIGK